MSTNLPDLPDDPSPNTLTPEENAEILSMPSLPDMIDAVGRTGAAKGENVSVAPLANYPPQRLNERALDAMARHLAGGAPMSAVTSYFGLSPRQVRALSARPDFARRIEYYRGRFQSAAINNITRVLLESDRILENVISTATNTDNKQWLECAKLLWDDIMPPKRAESADINVKHSFDHATMTALKSGIHELVATVPHRPRINPDHVTRGAAGMPVYDTVERVAEPPSQQMELPFDRSETVDEAE